MFCSCLRRLGAGRAACWREPRAPGKDSRRLRTGGEKIAYDILVVATGSRVLPGETPGLTGPGWMENAFDFYTVEGARALRDKFAAGDFYELSQGAQIIFT